MRVVCDTNLIVSSFLSPYGTPAKIIDKWKNQVFDLIVSEEILLEYQRVLLYQHIQALHHMTSKEVKQVIDDFRKFAIIVDPTKKISVVKDDPDDNKFVECAQEASASYIVSGDVDLLRVGQYQNIQIIPPAAFLAFLNHEFRTSCHPGLWRPKADRG